MYIDVAFGRIQDQDQDQAQDQAQDQERGLANARRERGVIGCWMMDADVRMQT